MVDKVVTLSRVGGPGDAERGFWFDKLEGHPTEAAPDEGEEDEYEYDYDYTPPASAREGWPADWTSPQDYWKGRWYFRWEVFRFPGGSSPPPTAWQLCLWQDQETRETCSPYLPNLVGDPSALPKLEGPPPTAEKSSISPQFVVRRPIVVAPPSAADPQPQQPPDKKEQVQMAAGSGVVVQQGGVRERCVFHFASTDAPRRWRFFNCEHVGEGGDFDYEKCGFEDFYGLLDTNGGLKEGFNLPGELGRNEAAASSWWV